jgi:phosphoserine phosphatase
MRLLLTRHEQTLENAQHIVQGYLGTISPLGDKQGDLLCLRLEDEEINHIYSSDLARAVRLAEKIKLSHPKTPLTLTEKLREVNFNKYLGANINNINWKEVTDLESQKDLQIRANDFYDGVISKTAEDETVLVIGHAGILKAITSIILNINYKDIWDMTTPKNCSLSIFEICGEEKNVVILNDTSHLTNINQYN